MEDVKCNFSFIWKINDFINCCGEVREYIWSPPLNEIYMNKHGPRLKLYPGGAHNFCKDFVSLFLYIDAEVNVKRNILFEISILNNKGEKFKTAMSKHVFTNQNNSRGWPKFLKRDLIIKHQNSLLVNDQLTISCVIYINTQAQDWVDTKSQLANDFENLLEKSVLSDFTIITQNKKLKVHKNILAARSKVFAAMFEHQMQENEKNCTEVTDVDHNVMKELLRFIYCGEVKNLEVYAVPLIHAAEKYELSSLKSVCEEALQKRINLQEYHEILNIANLYNCQRLKTKVIDFLIPNMSEIVDSQKFKSLTDSNPQILRDMLKTMSATKTEGISC